MLLKLIPAGFDLMCPPELAETWSQVSASCRNIRPDKGSSGKYAGIFMKPYRLQFRPKNTTGQQVVLVQLPT